MVKKTYKVSARIQIQDGTTSHIKRFKDEMEHDGNIGDPVFEQKILNRFNQEIQTDMCQTKIVVDAAADKPSTEPKKIIDKPAKADKGAEKK